MRAAVKMRADMGDTVNLASRLAGQAGPGDFLIGGETPSVGGEAVRAHPLGGILKGFSSEVAVYAVESVSD